jgi:hypothetical protein
MVRQETLSEVDGSKRITSPFSFPETVSFVGGQKDHEFTESDVAIPHPRSCFQFLEGSKPSNHTSGKEIPDDRCPASIITNHEPPSSALTDIVHRDEDDVVLVILEPTLESKSVMVEAQDGGALSV